MGQGSAGFNGEDEDFALLKRGHLDPQSTQQRATESYRSPEFEKPQAPDYAPRTQFAGAFAKAQGRQAAEQLRYLKSQGVETQIGPDGSETIATHPDGTMRYKPQKGDVGQDAEGRWGYDFRDERGQSRRVDLVKEGLHETDRTTGEQYIRNAAGERVVIGRDDGVAEVARAVKERQRLQAEEGLLRAEAAQLKADIEPQKAKLERFGATPKALLKAVENLSAAPSAQDAASPAGKALVAARKRLDDWRAANPDYVKEADAVAALEAQVNEREQGIRDRNLSYAQSMADAAGVRAWSGAPGAGKKASLVNGTDADPGEVQKAAASVAAERKAPTAQALVGVLNDLKANGAATVGGRPIDDELARAKVAAHGAPGGDDDRSLWEYWTGQLGAAVDSYQSTNWMVFGLLANLVGAKDAAKDTIRFARENEMDAQNFKVRGAAKIEDIGSAKDFGYWLGNTAVSLAPQIAETMVVAAGGALAGTAAEPGGGTVVGALGGLLGKSAVKSLMKRETEKLLAEGVAKGAARETAEAVVRQGIAKGTLKEALQGEIKQAGARAGAFLGSFASSYKGNAGEIYGNLLSDPEIDADRAELATLLFTAPAAALDSVVPGGVVGKFFKQGGEKAARKGAMDFTKRLAAELGFEAGKEGTTEGAQALVGFAAKRWAKEKWEPITPEEKSEFWNSVAAGAVGGVTYGAVGAVGEARQKPAPVPTPEQKAQLGADAFTNLHTAAETLRGEQKAAEDGGDTVKATAKRQAVQRAEEGMANLAPRLAEVPEGVAKAVFGAENVRTAEQLFTEQPMARFAAAEIGRAVGALYGMDAGKAANLDKMGAAQGAQPEAVALARDTAAGLAAARDLRAVIEGGTIAQDKAAALLQLGLLTEAEENGATVLHVTEDAIPLLPGALRQRLASGNTAGLRYTATPGAAGDLFHTLARAGMRRFAAAAASATARRSSASGATAAQPGQAAKATTAKAGDGGAKGAGEARTGETKGAREWVATVSYTAPNGEAGSTRVRQKAASRDAAEETIRRNAAARGRTVSLVEFEKGADETAAGGYSRGDEQRSERTAEQRAGGDAVAAEGGELSGARPGAESDGNAEPESVGGRDGQIAAALRAAGIRVDTAWSGSTQAFPSADGSLTLRWNAGQAAGRNAQATLDEELRHVAALRVKAREWKKARRPGETFTEWLAEDGRAMFDDLRARWAALPENGEKETIGEGIVAAFNLYTEDFGAETPTVTTPADVFDALLRGARTVPGTNYAMDGYRFVNELARMLSQAEARGEITEQTLREFLASVVAWLRAALAEVKALAEIARREGGPLADSELVRLVRGMEAELANIFPAEAGVKASGEKGAGGLQTAATPEVQSAPAEAKGGALDLGGERVPTAGAWASKNPRGKELVRGRWALVPLRLLGINKQVGADQDRIDREKTGAAQRAEIVANMTAENIPVAWANSATLNDGSPIITPDGSVVVGNNRAMALRDVYGAAGESGKALKYRQWAVAEARRLGLDEAADRFAGEPVVLVRVVDDAAGLERRELVSAANTAGVQARSDADNALADVAALENDALMATLQPSDEGGLNRDFLSGFYRTIGAPETLRTDGAINFGKVERRARNAMLAALLRDVKGFDRVLSQLVEADGQEGMRRTMAGVFRALPGLLKIQRTNPDLGILRELGRAVAAMPDFREAKTAGRVKTVEDYLAQGDMFEAPLEAALMRYLASGVSAAEIAEEIGRYVRQVESYGDPSQERMFPEPPPDKATLGGSMALRARLDTREQRRLRDLQSRRGQLRPSEEWELDGLERRAGQAFFDFAPPPGFRLDREEAADALRTAISNAQQLPLLARPDDGSVADARAALTRIARAAEAALRPEFKAAVERDGQGYPSMEGFMPGVGLTREERLIEAHFAQTIVDMGAGVVGRYRALAIKETSMPGIPGNAGYVNADLARMLYAPYEQEPEARMVLERATISPAGYVALRLLWSANITTAIAQGKTTANFYFGGMASGKTTAAAALSPEARDAGVVFDAVGHNFDRAKASIEQVRAAGLDPKVVFVYRPFEQAAAGAIRRLKKEGRPVSMSQMGPLHYEAQRVFLRLVDEYAGDSGVEFEIIANDGNLADIRTVSVDELRAAAYALGADESQTDATEDPRRAANRPAESEQAGGGLDKRETGAQRAGNRGDDRRDEGAPAGGRKELVRVAPLTGGHDARKAQLTARYRAELERFRASGEITEAQYRAAALGNAAFDYPAGLLARKGRAAADDGMGDLFAQPAVRTAAAGYVAALPVKTPAAVKAAAQADGLGAVADDLFSFAQNNPDKLTGGRPATTLNPRPNETEAGNQNQATQAAGTATGGELLPQGVPAGNRPTGDEGGDGQPAGSGGGAGADALGGRAELEPRRRPDDPNARNHAIADGETVALAGKAAKWAANVEAIRLLKRIESERRLATPEEKRVLARYTGWGWAGEYFNEENPRYAKQYAELRDLLTPEEFQAARESTMNAHYTALPVINAMWRIAQRLGFKGGNVLEPAGGVGHFFGRMPEALVAMSRMFGVELDSVSGRIFTALYPEAEIQNTGFEAARIPNNSVDLAISNVPFGSYAVPGAKDYPKLLIHDYFFARGLDKVKPGGLVVFITSDGTMDKGDKAVRALLAEKADLVGAIRLPNNAFAENAGTEVTTDIIVLRKKDGTPFRGEEWLNRRQVGEGEVDGATVPIMVNQYYAAHPEMALGRHSLEGKMYRGGDYALVANPGQKTEVLLDAAIARLPENIIGTEAATSTQLGGELAEEGSKEGSYSEKDGEFYQVQEGRMVPAPWLEVRNFGDRFEERITEKEQRQRRLVAEDWLELRAATLALVNAEIDPGIEPGVLAVLRHRLNSKYDRFAARWGTLNKRFRHLEKAAFMEDDPEYPLLQSLETEVVRYDDKGKKQLSWKKADIFTKRTREPRVMATRADNLNDAINMALAFEGAVKPATVARLLGIGEDEAVRQIVGAGRAFENPGTGRMETRERYLSGNVRKKLAAAEAAAAEDSRFAPNVEALRAAQPVTIELGGIFVQLSSRWLPGEISGLFAGELLGTSAAVRYIPEANSYTVRLADPSTPQNLTTHGTKDLTGRDILMHALNGTEPLITRTVGDGENKKTVKDDKATAAARTKLEQMKKAFASWVKTTTALMPDGRSVQDAVVTVYNETQNAMVAPSYTGDYMLQRNADGTPVLDADGFPVFNLPGLNVNVVRGLPHRASVVARILQEGSAMMAHGVGSGKTFSQIVAAMEMKRLGQANKPMIVVQKATIGQFAASVRAAYPSARVLVATEKTFEKRNRRRFLARIATGDYDMVIVTQPQFDRLMPGEGAVKAYFNERLASLEEAIRAARNANGSRDPSVKELEAAKKRLEAKMKRMLDGLAARGDDTLAFEQLGVDALLIDEAHAYKKTSLITKLRRVKGVPNDESQRAMGLEIKAEQLQDANGGRNVILATGTPITNSMAEAYIMLKLATPHVLKEYGIANFDEFAHTFGAAQTKLEYSWGGKWKMSTRFNRFVNGTELVTMIRSGFDVKMGNKALGLRVPKMLHPSGEDRPEIVVVPQTDAMRDVTAWIMRIANEYERVMKSGSAEEKEAARAVPIVTMQAGMAGAVDPRLLFPSAPDEAGSKVNTALRNVVDVWKETAKESGAQVIFCDRFKPMNTALLEAFAGGASFGVEVEDGDAAEPAEPAEGEEEKEGNAALAAVEDAEYSSGGFNLYHDMREKLVAMGVPREQVAIIHEYNTDARRAELFDKVNEGRVRVVIGSTEKLGVGVNMQRKLAAAHHLDPPRTMTPAMDEQRDGRIIRQGNTFKVVRNLKYGVEKSMDTGIYQMLESKGRFIAQALSGVGVGRSFEDAADEATMSMSEMKATLTGDMRVLRMAELQSTIGELEGELAGVEDQKSGMARRRAEILSKLRWLEGSELSYQRALDEIMPGKFRGEVWTGKIGGGEFSGERKDLAERLESEIRKAGVRAVKHAQRTDVLAMEFEGVRMELQTNASVDGKSISGLMLTVKSPVNKDRVLRMANVSTGAGILQSLTALRNSFGNEAARVEKEIAEARAQLPAIEEEIRKPWDRQAELDKARVEFAEIQRQLLVEAGEPVDNELLLGDGYYVPPSMPLLARKEGRAGISRETAERRVPNLRRAIAAMDGEIARLRGQSVAENPLRDKQLEAHESQRASYAKNLAEAEAVLGEDGALFARRSVDETQVRAYLSRVGVPLEKRAAAEDGISRTLQLIADLQVEEGNESYTQGLLDLSGAGVPAKPQGVANGGRSTKAEKGLTSEQVKGALGLMPQGLKEGFAQGPVVSSILPELLGAQPPAFDVRGMVIATPADFAALTLPLRSPYFESLKVAVMDADRRVVWSSVIAMGGLQEATVEWRTILRPVVVEAAKVTGARVVISHNHPSGDPSPSGADFLITGRVREFLRIAGVEDFDHIITNGETFYSFATDATHRLPARHVAPWERVRRADLPAIKDATALAAAADILRQSNPKTSHIVYVTTKLAVTAIERTEARSNHDLLREIVRGIAREGALSVFLVAGEGVSEMDVRRLADGMRAMGLKLMDASLSDGRMAKAEGLIIGESGALLARPSERAVLPLTAGMGDLIRANMGLAVSIAQGYSNIAAPRDEVVAVARRALVEAARGFDAGRGAFAPYAARAIRNALNHLYTKEQARAERETVRLDEPDENGEPRGARVPGRGERETLGPIYAGETEAEVDAAVAELPVRLREMAGWLRDGMSQGEIAAQLGVSKQAVSDRAKALKAALGARLRARGFTGVDAEGALFARGGSVDQSGVGDYISTDENTGARTRITGPRVQAAAAGAISATERGRMERSFAAVEGLRHGDESTNALWRESFASPRTAESRRTVAFETEAEARAFAAQHAPAFIDSPNAEWGDLGTNWNVQYYAPVPVPGKVEFWARVLDVPVIGDRQLRRIEALRKLGEGAEGQVFLDEKRLVAYKRYAPRIDSLGLELELVADSSVPGRVVAGRKRGNVATIAMKAAVLSHTGMPTEVAAVDVDGGVWTKQPLARAGYRAELERQFDRMGVVRVPWGYADFDSRGEYAFVANIGGDYFIFNDAAEARNVRSNTVNQARAIDLVAGRLWQWALDASPTLADAAKAARPLDGAMLFARKEDESGRQDAEYLAAVERGDMATAQRMVNEAARAAGYSIGPVYHGTGAEFDVFEPLRGGQNYGGDEPWIFLMADREGAEAYSYSAAQTTNGKSRVIKAFVRLTRPLIVKEDTDGAGELSLIETRGGLKREVRWALESDKYDGVHAIDSGSMMTTGQPFSIVIAKRSDQIKSAEAVTRDAQGRVIPLSQRFDEGKDSILYARKENPAQPGLPGMEAAPALPANDLNEVQAGAEWVQEWAREQVEDGEPFELIDVNERKRRHRLPAILFESAADVLERQRNKVAQKLSGALHKKANLEAEIEGRLASGLDAGLDTMTTPQRRKAKAEVAEYYRTAEIEGYNSAAVQTYVAGMSEQGKALLAQMRKTFKTTGDFAVKQGVQLWDSKLNDGKGGYRVIGNKGPDYWPRVLRDDLRRALEDPDKHAGTIDALKDDLRAAQWSEADIAHFFNVGAPGLLQRNDFFGQLEMAREVKLPPSFYEYDFDRVMPGFIAGYSNRMAQIMAFGQKLQRDPLSQDIFDEAIEESANGATREFIQEIQKQSYRIAERSGWNRFTATIRTLASGLLLANPFTTVPRNVISGVLANIEAGGVRRTLRGLGAILRGTVTQMTAKQLGIVKANMLDAVDYNDPEMTAAKWVRAFTGATLKYSGYNGSERFVRTLATATGMQWVSDYLAAAPNSKVAREAEAFMARVGVEPAAVRAEKGDFKQGPQTRTLLRRFVKESQFGYDVSQVPLWGNGPTGRLFYQFGRWGTQRARTLWRHVFEPAIFGELVEKDGKRYKVRRMKPLATALAAGAARGVAVAGVGVLTGEVFALVAAGFFDRDRDDEDWSVIADRLAAGDEKAVRSAGERVLNDLMMGGMLGILSQPLDMARAWVQGSRFKNPIEPPASSIPRSTYELLRSWYERGVPGSYEDAKAGAGADLWRAVRTLMPGAGAAADTVGRMGALVSDRIGVFERAQAERSLSNLRKAARRFGQEAGIEGGGMTEGRFAKRPQSASFDRLQDALLTGDTEGAQRVIDEYLARFGTEDPAKALRSLKSTVHARQPIKVGAHRSDEVKRDFAEWAAVHLPKSSYEEFLDLQNRYETTARALGLLQ